MNPLPPIDNQRCIQPCIGCQSMKLPLATFTDLMFLLYFIIHFFLMMAGSYTSQGLIQSTLDVRWPKKVGKLLRNIKISSRTSKKICRRMERLERKEYVKGFSTRKQRPNYKWAFIPQHWWQWKSLWKYFSKRNRQFIEYILNNWMLYGVFNWLCETGSYCTKQRCKKTLKSKLSCYWKPITKSNDFCRYNC